jgi:glutaredoxin
MKRVIFLLACLAILPLGAQAGQLYRWVDKAGKVHYGDTPPADVADVERKDLSSSASQNEDLPYETRRAQQNFPVSLYVTNGCGAPCDQARSMLNKRGVPFSEKLLKTQQEIDAFVKTSGSTGAPTLSIGKNYLSGFQESKWNAELDVAGYPKTATYRQRIAPAPKPSAPENVPAEGQPQPTEQAPAQPAAQ